MIEEIITVIDKLETLEDLDYLQSKIETTKKINRRTKAGREQTNQLLNLINQKAQQLIQKGATPF
jgi:hypothetical protein